MKGKTAIMVDLRIKKKVTTMMLMWMVVVVVVVLLMVVVRSNMSNLASGKEGRQVYLREYWAMLYAWKYSEHQAGLENIKMTPTHGHEGLAVDGMFSKRETGKMLLSQMFSHLWQRSQNRIRISEITEAHW